MNPAEHFACTRMRAILTRASCARQHQLASISHPRVGAETMLARSMDRCKGCVIGAEHRRGEASAPAVELVQVRAERRDPPRRCLACGYELDAGRYSYCGPACYSRGERLTRRERAAELEMGR